MVITSHLEHALIWICSIRPSKCLSWYVHCRRDHCVSPDGYIVARIFEQADIFNIFNYFPGCWTCNVYGFLKPAFLYVPRRVVSVSWPSCRPQYAWKVVSVPWSIDLMMVLVLAGNDFNVMLFNVTSGRWTGSLSSKTIIFRFYLCTFN